MATLSAVIRRATELKANAGYVLVSECTPRLTESKNKPLVYDMFSAVAAHLGCKFLCKHVIAVSTRIHTCRLLQECNEYLTYELTNEANRLSASLHNNINSNNTKGSVNGTSRSNALAADKSEVLNNAIDTRGILDYVKAVFVDATPELQHTLFPTRTSTVSLLILLRQITDEAYVDSVVSSWSGSISALYREEVERLSEGNNYSNSTGKSYANNNNNDKHVMQLANTNSVEATVEISERNTLPLSHSSESEVGKNSATTTNNTNTTTMNSGSKSVSATQENNMNINSSKNNNNNNSNHHKVELLQRRRRSCSASISKGLTSKKWNRERNSLGDDIIAVENQEDVATGARRSSGFTLLQENDQVVNSQCHVAGTGTATTATAKVKRKRVQSCSPVVRYKRRVSEEDNYVHSEHHLGTTANVDATGNYKVFSSNTNHAESNNTVSDTSVDVPSSNANFPLPEALVQKFNGCHQEMAPLNTLHESSPSLLSPLCSVPRTLASSRSSVDANISETPLPLKPILREINDMSDWRIRLDGVHKVEDYIASNNGTLPPHSVKPLLNALCNRLEESNSNIVVDVLRTVIAVVEAGGYEESKSRLRHILDVVAEMMGDSKQPLREEARRVVFLGVRVIGLDTALPCLQRSLNSESNTCRQHALEAINFGFDELASPSAISKVALQLLIPVIVRALLDRTIDVRIAAEHTIGNIIRVIGSSSVTKFVTQLKLAEQKLVLPAIERQVAKYKSFATNTSELTEPVTKTPTVLPNKDVYTIENTNMSSHRGSNAGITHYTLHSNNSNKSSSNNTDKPSWELAGEQDEINVKKPMSLKREDEQVSNVYTMTAANSDESEEQRRFIVTKPDKSQLHNVKEQHNTEGIQKTALVSVIPSSSLSSAATGNEVDNSNNYHNNNNNNNNSSVNSVNRIEQSKMVIVPATPTSSSAAIKEEVQDKNKSTTSSLEKTYSIQEIMLGIRSATPNVAETLCTACMTRLSHGEDCVTPEMMQILVERLRDNITHMHSSLALSIVQCLSSIFQQPICAQRCHSSLLFRLLGAIFDCLLSEQFTLNDCLIRAVNNMTLTLLTKCAANDVFSALMSRMTSYSASYVQSHTRQDFKYLEVAVKCLKRLSVEKLSTENVILCCHEFLLQHPPGEFRNLDDLPIRMIKVLLQKLTNVHGMEFYVTSNRLVGAQNLVTRFIHMCVDDGSNTNNNSGGVVEQNKSDNEQQAAEESKAQTRASKSPAPNKLRRKSK